MAPPLRAPVLLSDGTDLPDATSEALKALQPKGSAAAGGAAVIRIGNVAKTGAKETQIAGADPITLAAAIDRFQAAAAGKVSDSVIVVSADDPTYAMPAAAYAAKSGDSILFVHRGVLPVPTRTALIAHQKPNIFVLGPPTAVTDVVLNQLKPLGKVTRVAGPDPSQNSVAFARFLKGSFGWGVVDPGHGFVFASAGRPTDAAAASPLSASGTYGPLLVLPDNGTLPQQVGQYLLDVQPGYDKNPVRGVYNHGWLIGDTKAIPVSVQAQIDTLLEISPVKSK
jgi:hypothetical protein